MVSGESWAAAEACQADAKSQRRQSFANNDKHCWKQQRRVPSTARLGFRV